MSSNRFLAESHKLAWEATPFAGVTHKVLRVHDDATGVIELVRIAKNHALPPHRHLVMQAAYFMSGVAKAIDGSIINAGTYAEVPPGERHGTTAVEEVILLNMFNGNVSWFLDDGEVVLLKNDGTFATLGHVTPFAKAALP